MGMKKMTIGKRGEWTMPRAKFGQTKDRCGKTVQEGPKRYRYDLETSPGGRKEFPITEGG
jgi:hypothetical protein